MVHVDHEAVSPHSPADVLRTLPPYPVVLVTTRGNVLTVNQIAYFTFAPLRLGVAIAHTRYSFALLQQEREFVINVPDASLLEAVRICGSRSGRDGPKFDAAGLDVVPGDVVGAVRIIQCGAHIECRVEREVAFEERTWFVGRVVAASRRTDHDGANALMCGRDAYRLPGAAVAPR